MIWLVYNIYYLNSWKLMIWLVYNIYYPNSWKLYLLNFKKMSFCLIQMGIAATTAK